MKEPKACPTSWVDAVLDVLSVDDVLPVLEELLLELEMTPIFSSALMTESARPPPGGGPGGGGMDAPELVPEALTEEVPLKAFNWDIQLFAFEMLLTDMTFSCRKV